MKSLVLGAGALLVAILAIPLLFVGAGSADDGTGGGAGGGAVGGRARAIAGGNPLVPAALEPTFAAAAARFNVPEPLLLAVAAEESGFDPSAGPSTAGAVGVMQMLPSTFTEWARIAGLPPTATPSDPTVEIPTAAAMLAGDGVARGDLRGALLAYNHDQAYATEVLRRMADYAAWLTGPQRADRPAVTGWPAGQCTAYAAQLRGTMGAPVTWSGDAWEWLGNAAAQGVAVTTMPRPGEIAVYARGPGYDRADGHVAVVTAVTDTRYTVAEMNHDGPGVIDTRTIAWPDSHLEGFIP